MCIKKINGVKHSLDTWIMLGYEKLCFQEDFNVPLEVWLNLVWQLCCKKANVSCSEETRRNKVTEFVVFSRGTRRHWPAVAQ